MDVKNIKFDIIVQGGQSNAEGCGQGPVGEEYIPSEKILYLDLERQVLMTDECWSIMYSNKPFRFSVAKERVENGAMIGDFSLTFARSYVDNGLLEEDRRLLIIRVGIGGTGFRKGQWGLTKILYKKLTQAVDYALSLNAGNRVVAFLWHQGEHDAFERNLPERYKAQLGEQVRDFRIRYGEYVPFIAGDFVSDWKNKNIKICVPIIEKIKETVAENQPAAFVETADLLSNDQKIKNGDDIHFCRESLHVLGKRYFTAYQQVKNNI